MVNITPFRLLFYLQFIRRDVACYVSKYHQTMSSETLHATSLRLYLQRKAK